MTTASNVFLSLPLSTAKVCLIWPEFVWFCPPELLRNRNLGSRKTQSQLPVELVHPLVIRSNNSFSLHFLTLLSCTMSHLSHQIPSYADIPRPNIEWSPVGAHPIADHNLAYCFLGRIQISSEVLAYFCIFPAQDSGFTKQLKCGMPAAQYAKNGAVRMAV